MPSYIQFSSSYMPGTHHHFHMKQSFILCYIILQNTFKPFWKFLKVCYTLDAFAVVSVRKPNVALAAQVLPVLPPAQTADLRIHEYPFEVQPSSELFPQALCNKVVVFWKRDGVENAEVPSKRKDMIKRLTSPSCHDRVPSSDRYSRAFKYSINKIPLFNAQMMCRAPDSIVPM